MPKRLTYTQNKRRLEMWQKGFLRCGSCCEFLPVNEFYKNNSQGQLTNFGYRHYCKTCENSVKRNKPKKRLYHKERNAAFKTEAVSLAGGKCQRCDYSEFVAGLDFHHVYSADKKHTPTSLLYSKGVRGAWSELDKCCVLCASCHRAYAASEWKAEFIKRDGLGWTVGDPLPLDDDRYEKKPAKREQAKMELFYIRDTKPEQLKLLDTRTPYFV